LNISKHSDDFNPNNVNDGMEEIDILMDQLEGHIPDEAYGYDEFDVEEMVKSNRLIRDKIRDISSIVSAAISKAAILKKTVITHRDLPHNPEVKKKLKDIKGYQDNINKCKKHIENLRARIESVEDSGRMEKAQNRIKKLDKDTRKLTKHKEQLNKQLNNQLLTIKKLYSDPDYNDKVHSIIEEIRKLKDKYEKMKDDRKAIKVNQRQIINNMADIDIEYRHLKDKKIAIENNAKSFSAFDTLTSADEYEELRRRNENFDKIITNKQIKMIDKILAKESKD